jgi:predicted DNA-binding transcriptional regulator YafY
MPGAALGNTFASPPAGSTMRIRYFDAAHHRPERVFEPIRTFRGRFGEAYLEAFCHLRGERCTFRLDRIASWAVEDVQKRVSARPYTRSKSPLSIRGGCLPW